MNNISTIILTLLTSLAVMACDSKKDRQECSQEQIEKMILELPEVKEKQDLVLSLTNNLRGVALITDSLELNNKPYYQIQVGYNSDIRFESYYFFYINKLECDSILIMDIVEGDIVPIDQWRNNKNVELATSEYTLPYDRRLDSEIIEYSTLQRNIEGFDEWICDDDARYIALPSKGDVNVILVPMDCGDFPYRFYMLTIKNDKVVSSIYAEGEWQEMDANEVQEHTHFTIDELYNIKVFSTTKEEMTAKTYSINEEGELVANDEIEILN